MSTGREDTGQHQQKGRGLGLDSLKWAGVALLAIFGVVINIFYAGESLLYRMLAVIGLALVACVIALQTERGATVWELLKGARIEIQKVVWPTHGETVQTTALVIAFVFLVALILWGLDALLGWVVSTVIG